MRRILLSYLAALLCLYAEAQGISRIKEDPSYIWAEGSGSRLAQADARALDGLAAKLSETSLLPLDPSVRLAVWKSYLPDIRKVSQSVTTPSGSVIRYLEWGKTDQLFAARRLKVKELTEYAEKEAGKRNQAAGRTYLGWAETYLASLPPGDESLRSRVASLRHSLGEGSNASIRMRNIQTEVEAIRRALSPAKNQDKAPSTVPAPQPPAAGTDSSSIPPPRDTLLPLASGPSLKGEVDTEETLDPAPELKIPALPICDTRRENPTWTAFAMAEIHASPALGCMLAYSPGKWGAYVSARSNLISGASDYAGRSDGQTDFGYIWADGEIRHSVFSFSAGGLRHLSPSLRLFAGAGYGQTAELWKDTQGQWARIEDHSTRNICLEGGVVWQKGKLALAAGLSTIGCKRYAFLTGLGWGF